MSLVQVQHESVEACSRICKGSVMIAADSAVLLCATLLGLFIEMDHLKTQLLGKLPGSGNHSRPSQLRHLYGW